MTERELHQEAFTTRVTVRQTPAEREVRLRHAEYYIAKVAESDKVYLSGKQQEALDQFDRERGQVDTVRTWLWTQSPDTNIDTLLIAEAHSTQYIGDLRDLLRTVRLPQQERATAATKRQGDIHSQGRFLGNIGNAHYFLGQPKTAIIYYNQWLKIANDLEDRLEEAKVLGNLGNAYSHLGLPHNAINYYDHCLSIAREANNLQMECDALSNLGVVYMDSGEITTAITYYQKSLEIAFNINDHRGIGDTLGNLGVAYEELGDIRTALNYYNQHLLIARDMGDKRGKGRTLGNIGNIYQNMGEIHTAIKYHEQDLFIAIEEDDLRSKAYSSFNLGSSYYILKDWNRAIGYLESSYLQAKYIGDRMLESVILRCLADTQVFFGEYAKAEEKYKQSLAIAEDIDSANEIARTRWHYGQFLVRQGERERGVALMAECVAYEQRIGHAKAAEHAALVELLRAGGTLESEHVQ